MSQKEKRIIGRNKLKNCQVFRNFLFLTSLARIMIINIHNCLFKRVPKLFRQLVLSGNLGFGSRSSHVISRELFH